MPYLLALDQGTTSSRAIIFNEKGDILNAVQHEFPCHYPHDGWVEQSAEDIWQTSVKAMRDVLLHAGLTGKDIAAIGITNQRETTICWDKSGRPLANAIVWQDRRTAPVCDALKADGLEEVVTEKTGLLLDPYFSATKMAWLLNEGGLRQAVEAGAMLGTVDSYLLYRLTGGKSFKTDLTNASRTMLLDIDKGQYDDELMDIFEIPRTALAEVMPNVADFGTLDPEILGAPIPVTAMIGDQQSALVGQACFEPGEVKSTYGTGCFMVMNTGERMRSTHKLLSTIGYAVGDKITYALEGSIFIAGAAIGWLRDNLKVIDSSKETTQLAYDAKEHNVVMVPAFTGLGAPYWNAQTRGAMFGLTRDSGAPEIVSATLDSIAQLSVDLFDAFRKDGKGDIQNIRVDGGMANNDWYLQRLADLSQTCVKRPQNTETTAQGAAMLAAVGAGLVDWDNITKMWQLDMQFSPNRDDAWRQKSREQWARAVNAVIQYAK